MIFCTHRELRWRWAPPETECRGRMIIDPECAQDDMWVAVCDECELEIGIPPNQRKRWVEAQGLPS